MTGENRVLARFGLQRLNHSIRGTGLWALIQPQRKAASLAGVSDLVFGLGPLINAAGRLGDARDAVRVLLAADRHSALDYAAGTWSMRNKRRRASETDEHRR
jgi:single-stranded-DNA-specific exonuclease